MTSEEALVQGDFDPTDRERDPVAQLDALLAAGLRVVRSERMGGAYLVLTHQDVREVLEDPETYASAHALGGPLKDAVPEEVAALLPGFLREPVTGVVDTDGAAHAPLRATVRRAYAGPRVNPLAARIEDLARELADELDEGLGRGEVDLVSAYAQPLAQRVMGAALGIPQDDLLAVAGWAGDMASLITPGIPVQVKREAARRLCDYEEWATGFYATLPPGHDSVAAVYAHGEGEAGPMSAANALNNLLVHFVAGTVTTCHAVTSAAYQLLRDRTLWQRALGDPQNYAPRVLEEGLRHTSPHRGLVRVTTRATTLGGTSLPQGAHVLPLLGAANRDPAHIRDPARFDPDREAPRGHLAFGAGPHACVGAHLTRLEGRLALTTLLTRFPTLTLAALEEEPPVLPDYHFHGLAMLRVRLP
ncbi:cytochrome P450 [Streptomyces iconiensis]|uniref:Cytochrome P450 n=1 Tax=Streptomyces iconiensis TaxID=1384038 RepID=A0ABT6ZQC8_9ACTN|nr:cytochrome P450 [Streptomyces iconiensis]MDJ1130723.1 cytochrome P450 [Streptomyces iconiensis]